MCAQVAPSAEYLRGHGRVAVDVTALRRLWQHLPMLGLVILACMPVYAVVLAVCQLLNKDYYYYYYDDELMDVQSAEVSLKADLTRLHILDDHTARTHARQLSN